MKLEHKIIMISAAALMGLSPVAGVSKLNAAVKTTSKTTVTLNTNKSNKKAATLARKKTLTIVLGKNAYIYDAQGKRNKNYKIGKKVWPVLGKTAKLTAIGTKKIKGKLYYQIDGQNFIKAANVATVNGKKVNKFKATSNKQKNKAKKIKLTHNAYVYNKKGKRIKAAGKLSKGSSISYVGMATIKGKKYFNLGKGQYVKAANAKTIKRHEKLPDPTYIQLVHNSYVYDENGNQIETDTTFIKGAQYQALAAKEINGKWYYEVGEDENGTQWIKAVNAAVVSGPALIHDPNFKSPTVDDDQDNSSTIITLKSGATVYNAKGQPIKNVDFNVGHTARVSEARYLWLPSQQKAILVYQLASYKQGFISQDDVQSISGPSLSPVNTQEEAQEAGTIASASDKQSLNAAISEAVSVKNSDAYRLATSKAQSAYDKAISKGQTIASSSTASVLDVNNALAAIQKAQSALSGSKVSVTDLSNLSSDEQNAIIALVAKANNVPAANVHFINNNTQLSITDANGNVRTVNVSDYAQVTGNGNN